MMTNIRREDTGLRFFPKVGCNVHEFLREVLHVMQRRKFPISPFTAQCVMCETMDLVVTVTDQDDDSTVVQKYRDAMDDVAHAYGDDNV